MHLAIVEAIKMTRKRKQIYDLLRRETRTSCDETKFRIYAFQQMLIVVAKEAKNIGEFSTNLVHAKMF